MVIKIESIWKDERKVFKNRLKAISDNLAISFDVYDCRVELKEPYIIDEGFMKEKSRIKFAIYDLTQEWRNIQFNKYSK
jgi:hypothetical protein